MSFRNLVRSLTSSYLTLLHYCRSSVIFITFRPSSQCSDGDKMRFEDLPAPTSITSSSRRCCYSINEISINRILIIKMGYSLFLSLLMGSVVVITFLQSFVFVIPAGTPHTRTPSLDLASSLILGYSSLTFGHCS